MDTARLVEIGREHEASFTEKLLTPSPTYLDDSGNHRPVIEIVDRASGKTLGLRRG